MSGRIVDIQPEVKIQQLLNTSQKVYSMSSLSGHMPAGSNIRM